MTIPAPPGAGRRNTVVAVLAGLAVLLAVVLVTVLVPGQGSRPEAAAPAGPPPGPSATLIRPSASTGTPAPSGSPVSSATAAEVSDDPTRSADPGASGDPTGPPAGEQEQADPLADAARPAPAWLGTRPLAPAGAGPVDPQDTPPELLDRRLLTPDLLPPPTSEAFEPVVSDVPADVLARSTWQPGCPVAAEDLRYLLVQHRGFDGRLHTGEVLVHADAVDAVLAVFAAMHAERFPLEEVRVIRADELDAAPTGDGNVTSAFVCRPSVGGEEWSGHAYGRALDVNPFHNPYDTGAGADRVVLPELATAYTDRDRELPGMLSASSGAVQAAEDAGWGWGGRWSSAEDWMHLSADGR